MEQVPLVTVVVTTYNASQFVVETLESVWRQSYSKIELIVSDDGSSDNTVELARIWLREFGGRFQRTALLTVPLNLGVSANCNRGIQAATGDWIKFIAGDDALLPNCIEDNVRYVMAHPEAKVVFSKVMVFREIIGPQHQVCEIPQPFPMSIMNPRFGAEDQFKLLLISDRINFTPSYFFHKSAVMAVGGYDEENRIVEDYPMWLKLTRAGYLLHYFDIPTVAYRRHQNATNNKVRRPIVSNSDLKLFNFRKGFVHQFLTWDQIGNEHFRMNVAYLFENMGINRDILILRYLYLLLSVYMNPFVYISYFRKVLFGESSILKAE